MKIAFIYEIVYSQLCFPNRTPALSLARTRIQALRGESTADLVLHSELAHQPHTSMAASLFGPPSFIPTRLLMPFSFGRNLSLGNRFSTLLHFNPNCNNILLPPGQPVPPAAWSPIPPT